MSIILDIILVLLAVDFGSGLLHWLEDSYGRPDWPISGKWITRPNMLHHRHPRAFTMNNWLHSATVLLVFGVIILTVVWGTGALTWQVLLFVAIGVNANEFHKWNHLPRRRRPMLFRLLQDAGVLQSARHHGAHHTDGKDSHYCVITNLINPILDSSRFWRGLERSLEFLFGIHKRPEPELRSTTGPIQSSKTVMEETQ
jgi:plasmanylethanolamine desaturase